PQLRQSSMAHGNRCLTGLRPASRRRKNCNGLFGGIFGMRASASCALWVTGTLVLGAPPALAQEPGERGKAPLAAETPLTPDESAILGNALIFDPATLATPPKKPLRLPGLSDSTGYDVKRTEKADGSTTVVIKQPLPTIWDNSVGADLRPTNTNT